MTAPQTGEFRGDIEALTRENVNFREVLNTTPTQQLVVMAVQPGEDIPREKHARTTQLIRVEQGRGKLIIGGSKTSLAKARTRVLRDGVLVVIPPNTWHRVIATGPRGGDALKLYSVYSPPEHAPGTLHRRRQDDPEITDDLEWVEDSSSSSASASSDEEE